MFQQSTLYRYKDMYALFSIQSLLPLQEKHLISHGRISYFTKLLIYLITCRKIIKGGWKEM